MVFAVAGVMFNVEYSSITTPAIFEKSLADRNTSVLYSSLLNEFEQTGRGNYTSDNLRNSLFSPYYEKSAAKEAGMSRIPNPLGVPSEHESHFNTNTLSYLLDNFPDPASELWVTGFVWKGVYFKLLSPAASANLKESFHATKDAFGCIPDSETFREAADGSQYFFSPAIMTLVESGHFALFATPILEMAPPDAFVDNHWDTVINKKYCKGTSGLLKNNSLLPKSPVYFSILHSVFRKRKIVEWSIAKQTVGSKVTQMNTIKEDKLLQEVDTFFGGLNIQDLNEFFSASLSKVNDLLVQKEVRSSKISSSQSVAAIRVIRRDTIVYTFENFMSSFIAQSNINKSGYGQRSEGPLNSTRKCYLLATNPTGRYSKWVSGYTNDKLSKRLQDFIKELEYSDWLWSYNGVHSLLTLVRITSKNNKSVVSSVLLCEWLWEIHLTSNFAASGAVPSPVFGNEQNMRSHYRGSIATLLNELLDINGSFEVEQRRLHSLLAEEFTIMKTPMASLALSMLSDPEAKKFFSNSIFATVVMTPLLDLTIFLEAFQQKFKVGLEPEHLKQMRDDKYRYLDSTMLRKFDISDVCCPQTIVRDLWSFKDLSKVQLWRKLHSEKHSWTNNYPMFSRGAGIECSEREVELFDHWINFTEPILLGLLPFVSSNYILMKGLLASALQELGLGKPEKAITAVQRVEAIIFDSNIINPEDVISFYCIKGLLAEKLGGKDSIDKYLCALVLMYRLKGDPRGRGTIGHPIFMFLGWRLGLQARLLGKTLEAEYFDELFDCALVSGAKCELTAAQETLDQLDHSQFLYDFQNSKPQTHIKVRPSVNTDEQANEGFRLDISSLSRPFSHWTSHRHYIKGPASAPSIILVSNSIGAKLCTWLLNALPCFCPSGLKWKTFEVKGIILAFEHRLRLQLKPGYMGESTVDNSISNTLITSGFPTNRHNSEPEDGRQLSFLLRSEAVSFNPKGVGGYSYSWGSNGLGQLGSVSSGEGTMLSYSSKPFILYSPRVILPLKNILIDIISCGHGHTLATMKNGMLLSWGCNRAGQLGQGPLAPDIVPTPSVVQGLTSPIKSMSCGSEHSLAVCQNQSVFAWGQGDGGILGLGEGDLTSKTTPVEILSLKQCNIAKVKCGGLHNLALTSEGKLYSWGRGEGGQLGHPKGSLTTTKEGDMYLSTPMVISGLQSNVIEDMAAGDAHSLCLDSQGKAFAWGFSSSGQLGLGMTAENHSFSTHGLQVFEPSEVSVPAKEGVLQIYSGQTFTFFQTKDNEIFACGINDYNQLALPTGSHASKKIEYSALEMSKPTKVEAFSAYTILSISAGSNHSLAAVSIGGRPLLISWGCQKQGQLGLPQTKAVSSMPGVVSRFSDLTLKHTSAGAYHSALIISEEDTTHPKLSHKDQGFARVLRVWNELSQ